MESPAVNTAALDQSDHEAIAIDQVHVTNVRMPIGGKLPTERVWVCLFVQLK